MYNLETKHVVDALIKKQVKLHELDAVVILGLVPTSLFVLDCLLMNKGILPSNVFVVDEKPALDNKNTVKNLKRKGVNWFLGDQFSKFVFRDQSLRVLCDRSLKNMCPEDSFIYPDDLSVIFKSCPFAVHAAAVECALLRREILKC